MATVNKSIIPLIVISQVAGTSLWFAGNAVINDVAAALNISAALTSYMTSAVQLGFIMGTLVFAVLTIADRFSPSRVFFACALAAATANLGIAFLASGEYSLLFFRVITGFFLAGIYPVGMKIAADHFETGLGKALGYLVGALVLGTALPHLLKDLTGQFPWEYVIYITSFCVVIGGLLLLLFVPDGPYRKSASKFQLSAFFKVFEAKEFRAAAFGYFGHMWELYTFWSMVPLILIAYNNWHNEAINVSLFSFLIIGVGSLSCVIGGYLSQTYGSRRVAVFSLSISGFCCLLSPLAFSFPPVLFIGFLLIWGMAVIADSPQFSSLVAQRADAAVRGTALTIVNCLGFALTIVSIQFIAAMEDVIGMRYLFLLLLAGPIFGLWSIGVLKDKSRTK